MEISTSILSSKNYEETINKLLLTKTDYIHIDIMDGIFVPNKSLNTDEDINLINNIKGKKLDIHLMVENPVEYIEKLNNNNIEYITIHYEINKNLEDIIKKIKEKEYKVGISIKPKTKIKVLKPMINKIDLILIMSVEPGLGGQKFINKTKCKIRKAKKIINNNIKIEVDGGINNNTIKKIKKADIAVSGSYIINNDDYNYKIDQLKNMLN